MSRIAYVNGRYVPHRQAAVSIDDRGYQFADGVYEVIALIGGKFVDLEPHLDRLDRSLGALGIAWPMARAALSAVIGQVARRNGVRDGIVYLQIGRGVAPREHAFPRTARPSLVVTARAMAVGDPARNAAGVAVIGLPDLRWLRRDIKSISLLPNVLAKQQAREAGAYEAWLVDKDGKVTEGTSTNAWIVTRSGELRTHPADRAILHGITRRSLVELLRGQNVVLNETPFTLEEAKAAREAFLTSTTAGVVGVVRIDGVAIGDGSPGELTRALRARYFAHAAGEFA